MCTVTFIPLKNQQFVLTSNRDEQTARPTIPPKAYPQRDKTLYFPKDERAGGTWITMTNQKTAFCLLNGAFEKHEHNPPYARSRGLIVLEAANSTDIPEFALKVDLEGVEPFTLVCINFKADVQLYELRWDGSQKHFTHLPANEPRIWSSATLYPKPIQAMRLKWFNEWIQKPENLQPAAMLDFHLAKHDVDKRYDLQMELEEVALKTVSVTQIENANNTMYYHDLIANQKFETDVQ